MSDLKAVNVLHVEDDDLDIIGLRRAFIKAKIANPITVAHDGIEALDVLRGRNGTPQLSRPYIVLLDLNLPRMDGISLLKEIREDSELRHSIVFVMTTSKADEDKMRAYDLGVAGYIVKSDPASSFIEAATMLSCYWKVVELLPQQ